MTNQSVTISTPTPRGQGRRGWIGAGLRLGVVLGAAPMMVWVSGCANGNAPTVVRLDEADLQRLARERFPRQQRMLEVLDVSFEPPSLKLLAAQNRLGARLVFSARERLLGHEWPGELEADAALRWDAPAMAAVLTQVRVQSVRLGRGGTPAALTERLSRFVAEQMLDGLAVWRPQGEQAERLRKAGLVPSAVTVTARGVEISLVPGTLPPAPPDASPAPPRPDTPRPGLPPRSTSV
jgi:hypothetical protein